MGYPRSYVWGELLWQLAHKVTGAEKTKQVNNSVIHIHLKTQHPAAPLRCLRQEKVGVAAQGEFVTAAFVFPRGLQWIGWSFALDAFYLLHMHANIFSKYLHTHIQNVLLATWISFYPVELT